MNKTIFISTDTVEAHLRNDFLRELVRPLYEVLPGGEDRGAVLEASLEVRRLGPSSIGRTTFNSQRYVRERQTIVRGGCDDYFIQLVTAGPASGLFGRTSISPHVGDIFIVDMAQAYRIHADAGSRITIAVSRALLERIIGRKNLHGVVLKAAWPMTRLLADYLQGLFVAAEKLGEAEAITAQEALFILLSGCLEGQSAAFAEVPYALQPVLRERVLEYIERHIAEPDLTPVRLARRFNVSRTHLYRIFEADGGIATLIREKRLDHAYLQLTAPALKTQARFVKEIAFDCGFASSEQFIRAFKVRFGMTPSEAKANGAIAPVAYPSGLHEYFQTYATGVK
jgi:AraC-like DNA-binding protein